MSPRRYKPTRRVTIYIGRMRVFIDEKIYRELQELAKKHKLSLKTAIQHYFGMYQREYRPKSLQVYDWFLKKCRQLFRESEPLLLIPPEEKRQIRYPHEETTVEVRTRKKPMFIPYPLFKILESKCQKERVSLDLSLRLLLGLPTERISRTTLRRYLHFLSEVLSEYLYKSYQPSLNETELLLTRKHRRTFLQSLFDIYKKLGKKDIGIFYVTLWAQVATQGGCVVAPRTYLYFKIVRVQEIPRLVRNLIESVQIRKTQRGAWSLRIWNPYIIYRNDAIVSALDKWIRTILSQAFDRTLDSESCWCAYYIARIGIRIGDNLYESNDVRYHSGRQPFIECYECEEVCES